ncbi:hypothetical protein [Siphonobacter sp. SORGH_AS_0500]|uniref:hypothetical protein n=1 Tax=Siphonobacter sp. SORGH_AS_0500 TaxID=1864824 RepID=UPI00286279BA|nr:hypothetical protein [Siphonobacter sp. SORGH_AS_0500]MDR6194750.1 hypothetical protein [Siphonobacter sp. SORGH_AS_0500]
MKPVTIIAQIAFKTRPIYRDQASKGIVFSILIPDDLKPFLSNPNARQLSCEARMWKGLKWGQMGTGAEVELTGEIITGPKGGQKFHCTKIGILNGVPRTPPTAKLPAFLKKLQKEAKAFDKKPESPQLTMF